MFDKRKRQLLSWLLSGSMAVLASGASADTGGDRDARIIGMQLPVWTEELGEVPLDQYTREELSKMVDEFWTPERIKNAIPLDLPVIEDVAAYKRALKSFAVQNPEPAKILSEPALPQAQDQYVPYAITNMGTANGKIYFHHKGKEYVCSGAAMNSSSKRIVATAAHCIHSGPDPDNSDPNQGWHSNVRFIPNYHWGSAPNGEFKWAGYNGYNGYYAWMPQDWIDYGETTSGPNAYQGWNSDFVFITTHNNASGQRVVDAVGGHGLWTNDGGANFYASIFGYPTNINWGQTLQACAENTSAAVGNGYTFSLVFSCNFGGGSSGGPWLHQYNNATGFGYLRGVTSFGPKNNAYIASPQFYSNIVFPLFYYADNDSNW